MQVFHSAYADTGRFSNAVLDHLANDDHMREFLAHPPDMSGLRAAADQRQFGMAERILLCAALERQYQGMDIDGPVRANLDLLRKDGTLTVTTGHQLCLFTGPLYVPFKILNTIRLARTASAEMGRPVVPVFWMASEDHDLEEVDHAHINGRRIKWEGGQHGAVGRMELDHIGSTLDAAIEAMGPGEGAAELADLLRSCYRPERTLAEATRCFLHGLFGRYGLLIIDGDDAELKGLFVPVMQEEVMNQVASRSVSYADERLKERYAVQAHARDINLFHMRPGHRARIELNGADAQVLNGGPRWSIEALMNEVSERPQDFSPNVILRPVYQESVLPNIAYIGGGGELAYWIQLRWLFQALRVPMPVVLLRTSAGWITAKHLRQWEELGLGQDDLFAPLDQMKAKVVGSAGLDLESERHVLNTFYDALLSTASAVDASLKGSVEARRKAALHGLDRVEKSMVRAAKRKQETTMQRMDRIHEELFPGGVLQERKNNVLPLLATRGTKFLDELLDALDPLDARFSLIVED